MPQEPVRAVFSSGFRQKRRAARNIEGRAKPLIRKGFCRIGAVGPGRTHEKQALFASKTLGGASGLPYIPPCRGVIQATHPFNECYRKKLWLRKKPLQRR